ncbi:hypothetical protein Ahy_A02g006282 isoform C [Arachis hypogaea]|uniref:Uncharacterized protein n=1 Tax=Arachis hypogaea TaxID=3818 RepID=A0A445E9D5_ARAHY|nr:hypothetical protein Ahy_A02g006282 isoform C [Arachis hypogaea]
MVGCYFVPMVRSQCCESQGPRRTQVADFGVVSTSRCNKAAISFVGQIQRQRWNIQKLLE